MTTAQEVELKMQMASRPMLDALEWSFKTLQRDIMDYGMHVALGRNVSAARARKLRRRGEAVLYVGRTETGKARYCWMRRMPPLSIYKA